LLGTVAAEAHAMLLTSSASSDQRWAIPI